MRAARALVLTVAAAALPSLLAACFIVTGSSDGYVAARDAGPAVDAGTGGCLPDVFTIATSCVSAKDCAEGEICCLGAQGTINSAATSASNAFILSCITSTCQTSCNSLELQLCASNAECTEGGVQSGGDADVVDAAPSDTDSAVGAETGGGATGGACEALPCVLEGSLGFPIQTCGGALAASICP